MSTQPIPAWINRAAVAIINSVDANPAYHIEAKNSTAGHIAAVIAKHDPTQDLLTALELLLTDLDQAKEVVFSDPDSAYGLTDSIDKARAAIARAKGESDV